MLIGVKGRLQTRVIENEDGTKKKKTEIVAEKVTFLATSPSNKKGAITSSSEGKSKKTKKSEKAE